MPSHPLKGSNLTTVRGINERLILHILRIHKRLSKADATRITGLSANAISVIFRSLEADGLLIRGEPVRGRIGQPSVPMMLNPNACRYIGFKIGRRSFEMVVVNFVGTVLATEFQAHQYPTPDATLEFIERRLQPLIIAAGLRREDIAAFNVATPFELWSWTSNFGAPKQEMEAWRAFDAAVDIGQKVPWPVTVENDGTAACRAELVFAPATEVQDSVYFFVGTFIGGGIVLNGGVFPGRRGNAGGFGPLRIPDEPGGARLVDHASVVVLEQALAERDVELAKTLCEKQDDWSEFEPELTQWLDRAGRSLGHAIVSALAVMDFESVVIDGAFPSDIRNRLVNIVIEQMDRLDLQGVEKPDIRAGHFGTLSRAMGAAAYQISTEYMIDQNTLLRDSPSKLLVPK